MSRSGQGNLSKPGGRQSRQFGAACTALAWLAIQRAATPHQAKEGGGKLHRERSLFTSMASTLSGANICARPEVFLFALPLSTNLGE